MAAALLALACDRGTPAAASTSATASAAPVSAAPVSVAAAHAAATAKPGSHEDWCGEHQVPESQCTRCNPDLVPAFKATNDWCAEHGLPESQCLKCNPNLKIVRPPQGTP
jgi:hypothetical protein